MALKRSAKAKFIDGPEEAERFLTVKPLPPVQAAIERDRLDAQLAALEGNK
jgi:hypothetical protein